MLSQIKTLENWTKFFNLPTIQTELNKINWKKNGADIVLECTGKNNSKEK